MIVVYDKNGNKFDEFDKSKIIALHKFGLNRIDTYNFEYEYILNSFKSKIEFHSSDEIFEIYYPRLNMGNYYTEKYYLICEISFLDQYILGNFDVKFKTFFESINSYGELYIENKTIKYGLKFDEIDRVYILKDMPIVQFYSKGYRFEGIDKYTNYNILENLESKKIFEKLKSNIYEDLK